MRNQTILVFICYFLAVIATQSGTLRDNFNDNNVDGWEEITAPLNKKYRLRIGRSLTANCTFQISRTMLLDAW